MHSSDLEELYIYLSIVLLTLHWFGAIVRGQIKVDMCDLEGECIICEEYYVFCYLV